MIAPPRASLERLAKEPVRLTPRPVARSAARLNPVLIRIPPEVAEAMRALSRRTRIRLADHYREAIADLLRKYGALPGEQGDGDTRGAA